jgi:hypothetical protein
VLLHPLKDSILPPLAARGRAILGLLDDVSHAEALDLACRTLVGVLLAARPRFEDSTKDQASYNTLCREVGQWIKRELKPLRFRDNKGRLIVLKRVQQILTLGRSQPLWVKVYTPNSRSEGSGHTEAARAAVLADLGTAAGHFKALPRPIAAPEGGSSGREEVGTVAGPVGA